jgi:RND family efflux transporter MFP subunit
MELEKTTRPKTRVAIRLFLCALVLSIGIAGMMGLAKLKEPPTEVGKRERPLRVETLVVERKDIQVVITGYGEMKAKDVVSIAPEVSGKIVEIHPNLEVGKVIPKGETLFVIDERDYHAACDQAEAAVSQQESIILRLQKEYGIARSRLKTILRNRDLAKAQLQRYRELYTKEDIVSRSSFDKEEQAYNLALDQADQMAQTVEVYPIRIEENRSLLDSHKAKLETAKINLERCRVVAPFDGRVKTASVEVGQHVAAGQSVITLADDSVLEMDVPIDSRDASRWLRFKPGETTKERAWFEGLEPVECKIRWTEDAADDFWVGRLDRVVKFDEKTRTVILAVVIEGSDAVSREGMPLVEGMFCSVEIPGKTMTGVFELPRWSVTLNNTVYVSIDGRLKTLPVTVARVQGEKAFVQEGLNPGDIVVTTRLVDPLENALLKTVGNAEQERSQ